MLAFLSSQKKTLAKLYEYPPNMRPEHVLAIIANAYATKQGDRFLIEINHEGDKPNELHRGVVIEDMSIDWSDINGNSWDSETN